ncbi:SDR family NAD(P)-dependent oxidoreductase [Archangium sp.]|uniref:SDR family NAD(P)-dependent oxidoreductase n=1 Tax=Archangium sp. TaxID=1872627 RepID=UPI002D4F35A8|nr:SDR family NAD(P)-dependent oxidoreductase [Archangium sp.]HYO53931.1 SDR family NAD(P)-dependent oxidoreductase [Archangium sp.]
MDTSKVAAVVGVGPGLGAALARRFAREGYAVGLLARSESNLHPVRQELEKAGGRAGIYTADAADAASLGSAFARLRTELGAPEVCIYNAGSYKVAGVLELTPEQLESSWRIGCLGGFLMAREAVPAMLERGRGTLLFTGATASLRGTARFAAFAVSKFGLRALAQSLARELGPRGIHVAHVVIDGMIDTGSGTATKLSPDAIAETYWQLHRQDASAWTQELDLRPATEKF